jgi:digeranylgeranylglycerophospholipid reductase
MRERGTDSMRYDLVVVGAGPAGSTAARYAARRGLKLLLVDKRQEIGVPVQCGEYVATNEEVRAIFPTVMDLEDLMAVPYRWREIDTPVIRLFTPKGRRYDVPFRGFTVQRDRMDQGLARQAVEEGAELLTETSVTKVRGEDVETNHGTFHGRVVIGADGPRSTVAKSVGLPWPVSAPAMSTTATGEFGDATDLFFGNLAPGGYAWIIPKRDCANVGLGTWQHYRGNLRRLFDGFLERQGLVPGKATGGFVPVMGPVERTVRDNALLVGDAAGHVMATNGGGINVAMICGRIAGNAAADHVLSGAPLDAYETRWRTAVGGPLAQGAKIKRLADRFFGSDRLLELSMLLLGRRRMARAIRCEPLLMGRRAKAL